MFGVISVWALFWWAGSTLGWLGPPPSTAAPLHFLLFHSCARSLSLSLSQYSASVIREWIFLFPPIALPSQHPDLSGSLGRKALSLLLIMSFHSGATSQCSSGRSRGDMWKRTQSSVWEMLTSLPPSYLQSVHAAWASSYFHGFFFFFVTRINFNGIKKKRANKLVLAKETGKTCLRYEN